MTIFVIARGYPETQEPQWGCFEKDQAEALAQCGHNVIMISFDGRFRWRFRKLGFTYVHKNNVHSINFFACPSAIMKLIGTTAKDHWENWQLRHVYAKAVALYGQPDILYSHYLFLSHKAVSLKKQFGKPLVMIEHWSEINKDTLLPMVQKIGNETYHYADAIITVAKSLQTKLKEHFNVSVSVVYNIAGVEFQYKHTHKMDKFTFVATGSLIMRKGFDLLPLAFIEANLPKSRWQMNIIGEGKERQHLQQLINQYGLTDNIRLLGPKNKEQIALLLNQSDAFILPSRNENFSVAVLEALACGLPVISSICGGIRECINDKNGLLFPVDDVNQLANAIRYMFSHYTEYDRQAIADDCQARFSPQVIAQQLTDIFQQVLVAGTTN